MSEADENLPAPTGGLPAALGIELLAAEGETARGRIEVSERTLQPYGIVHGGIYAALAETVASAATHMHVAPDGKLAIGQSNHTTFLRPVTRRAHRGKGQRPPQRPHHLGLGRRHERRRWTHLRDLARRRRRARAARLEALASRESGW